MYSQKHFKKQNHFFSAGFTLIEVMVSISIIALLSSVVMSATNSARKNARDSKRISSIRELQVGLELYFSDNQTYPPADVIGESANRAGDPAMGDAGNWDTPFDNDFLTSLVGGKYMQGHVFDPLGVAGSSFQNNLRYYRFPAGSWGCPVNRGAFYVLGVVDMETSSGRHQLSPGWNCPNFDFGNPAVYGFEFVVGKYES
ncbi:MAG: type II secretion system GspH family protein [Candidatus Campbellbacteria bacterium]|nr:type II secretion system GspH family protein [Candidatus Campbellbacteria bacterium]